METAPDIVALNESIKNESAFIDLLQSELSKVIVGQKGMVEGLLIGLLADGHIFLEGVPGLAKTLAAQVGYWVPIRSTEASPIP